MTVVYVLTSQEKDAYLEMLLISITSVKRNSPNVAIKVIMDTQTRETMVGERAQLLQMDVDIVVVDLPQEYNQTQKSRYLKTSLIRWMDSDFVFLDLDTIVYGDLAQIVDNDIQIGAVKEMHCAFSQQSRKEVIIARADAMGFHPAYNDMHFNSGCIYVKYCNENIEFFQEWHDLWKETMKKGIHSDQISLNELNHRYEGIICELDGSWNCQIRRKSSCVAYLNDVKVLHYSVKTVDEGIGNVDTMEKVITLWKGIRSGLADEYLASPRKMVSNLCVIGATNADNVLMDSPYYRFGEWCFRKHKSIYNFVNRIAKKFI